MTWRAHATFWTRLSSATLVLATLACAKSETGRSSLVPLPDSVMNPMGVQAYADMKTQAPVSSNAALTAKVNDVARQIATATGQKFDWEFTLFDSKEVNAWCLPGGKVGVYTGLIPYAKTNAGLAAVIGHEVAHAVLRHSGERATEQLLLAGVAIGADLTADALLKNASLKPYLMGAIGVGSQLGVALPFSRGQEAEADEVGLGYMAKAGYDPAEAVALWKRMAQQSGEPPEILSDHPSSTARIEALEKLQASALATRAQAATQIATENLE